MESARFSLCLTALAESGADFIVVGGLAAVLHGAPVHTYDVDIVHSRSPENIQKLLAVLHSIDAMFRIQPERWLRVNETHSPPGKRTSQPHNSIRFS